MCALNRWIVVTTLVLVRSAVGLPDDLPTRQPESKSPASVVSFDGNRSFSASELRDSLNRDSSFLLACHPLGDPDALASVIEQRLTAGYRTSGFAEVAIRCQRDVSGETWNVAIDEGKQYRCGRVLIRGAQQMDVSKLRQRLTEPYPNEDTFASFVVVNGETQTRWVDEKGKQADLEDPVWKIGEPVKLDKERALSRACQTAISDLGFSGSLNTVSIQCDPDTETASMIVDIINEGEPTRIAEIDIDGLYEYSPASVAKYLGVKSGDAVNREIMQEFTRRLWQSGRFKNQNVRFEMASGSTLSVRVEEIAGVPGLDQALSENAKVFLRAGQWVAEAIARGDDMEIVSSLQGYSFRLIQSTQGLLAEAKGPSHEKLSLLVDAEQLLFNHSSHPQMLRFSPAAAGGYIKYGLSIGAASDSTQYQSLNFNGSIGGPLEAGDSPLQFVCSNSPSDWLPFAFKEDSDFQMRDGQLVTQHEAVTLAIDVDSGRIDQWTSEMGATRFVSGAFEAARQSLLEQVATKPNAFDSLRPLSSSLSYLLSEPVVDFSLTLAAHQEEPITPIDPELVSAIRKLVEGGVLGIGDAFVVSLQQQNRSKRFVIPNDEKPPKDWKQIALRWVGQGIVRYAPDLFAEETWPMQLARQTGFIAMGSTEHTQELLARLLRDENNGPLCYASAAILLSYVSQDAAKVFAKRSLDVMNLDAFQRDFETLQAATPVSAAAKMMSSLQRLNSSEVEALGRCCKDDSKRDWLHLLYEFSQLQATDEASFVYQMAEEPLRESMRRTLER
ncbi:BamA/TamA family outer membrane protein [Novipirellula artificiosorum]|uniref:Outer membrane protein assembly factor BamA n=1 Tax=Novipirellula artificiosorum TaxID=2528016 RepID=A0A5C6E2E0_9BACT|nr:hypothetical protein [Novipirellula artificiosorum]TWU42147.1 Outer membrane protein assembly factor BamA [Novipirellula artificiosorum]